MRVRLSVRTEWRKVEQVAAADEALERSLGPVESVGVDLVGADRDLDRRIILSDVTLEPILFWFGEVRARGDIDMLIKFLDDLI